MLRRIKKNVQANKKKFVQAGKLYDTIKYLGDIKHEIPTQCVLERVLFKKGDINIQVVPTHQCCKSE